MSYLSDELRAVSQKNGWRQIDVTKKTDLGVAHISRIFSGRQTYVTPEDLKLIVSAIAKTSAERARIYRARMWDSVPEEAGTLVRVDLRTGGNPERVNLGVAADPDVKKAVEFLYQLAPKNPAVGRSLVAVAEMMGME